MFRDNFQAWCLGAELKEGGLSIVKQLWLGLPHQHPDGYFNMVAFEH